MSNGSTFTLTGLFTGAGTLVVNNAATSSTTGVADSGTVLLEDASNNYSGGSIVNAGTLYLYTTSSGAPAGTGPISIGAATLEIRQFTTAVANPIVLTDASSQIYAYPGYTNYLAGGVSGNGTLNKAGTGSTYLTTPNTYTGGTNVSVGTLRANATGATGTGVVSLNGGLLAGNGSVGSVVVNSGGTIGAGSSTTNIATLTTADETWNGGGAFLSKFNASTPATGTFDRLTMTSLTVNASPTNTFAVTLSNTSTGVTVAAGTSIVLADDTDPTAANPFNVSGGTTFASLAALQATLVLNAGTAVTAASGSLQLDTAADGTGGFDLILDTVSAPEPTSLLMLGTVVAPLVLGRRRKAEATTA